jgi:hypothetical protein
MARTPSQAVLTPIASIKTILYLSNIFFTTRGQLETWKDERKRTGRFKSKISGIRVEK